MSGHGFSDAIHHALAFCAKHHPGPVSRYDEHNPLLSTANVAVILARHRADETTIVAGVLKQLVDASPPARLALLQRGIASRFGGLVAGAVEAAAEPRLDPAGRQRTWKAMRYEVLARLGSASPRVVDVWTATEIHHCGIALTDIRRLGIEYARAAAPAPPEDLLWWYAAFADVLAGRPEAGSSTLQAEFGSLSQEVAACLAAGGP